MCAISLLIQEGVLEKVECVVSSSATALPFLSTMYSSKVTGMVYVCILVDTRSTISVFSSAIDMGVNAHNQNVVLSSYSGLFGIGSSRKDIYHLCIS